MGQTKTRFFFLYLIECKVGVSSTVSCHTASVASSKVDCSNGVDALSPVFRSRNFRLFVKLVSQTSCTPAVSIFLPQNQHQVPAGPAPPRCPPQHRPRAKSSQAYALLIPPFFLTPIPFHPHPLSPPTTQTLT